MGKHVHRLSNIDVITRTADCSNCGRVRLHKKLTHWRCQVAKRQERIPGWYPPPADAPCPICNRVSKLIFDHDHETGAFRGWICSPCNIMLGHAYDNPDTLKNAALYLQGR